MANNYTFLDASGVTQTAASSVVNGAHQPLVQIASIVGGLPVTFSGSPSISGAVTVVGTPSISGAVTIVGNPSISGTVQVSGSIVTIGSLLSGVYLKEDTTNTPIAGKADNVDGATVSASPQQLAVMGRNTVFNGTTWDRMPGNTTGVFVTTKNSSVISYVIGSVAAAQSGTWAVSVVGGPLQIASTLGTYAEDAGHVDGNPGQFVLGVRNDAVASFVSANIDYTPLGLDSAGRILIKPFAPSEALVQGTGSTMGIFKSSLIGVSGTGLRNYLTDVWIANTGSVATLVSFSDSDGSVIGKTIAPATGGSNIHLATPMRTGSLNSQVEFTAATGSSVLHVTGFGYKAP